MNDNVAVNNTDGQENTVSIFSEESIDSILGTLNGAILSDSVIEDVAITTTNEAEQEITREEQLENPSVAETETDNDFVSVIENDFNTLHDEHRDNESRFSGAEWFEKVKQLDILIAGIGGIGSWASFLVARLRPNSIYMFDNDIVDETNLSGQLFSYDDIDNFKVNAIYDLIYKYSGFYNTSRYRERYTGQITEDIMMCGFDNMAARKTFFQSWKNHVSRKDADKKKNCLFVDARLGMEELQIFTIRGDETELMLRYEKDYLFDDSEAEQVPCSMKQTSFMASMVGSMMTNILVNHAMNVEPLMDVRPIPFITLYNAEDMRMKLKF